MPKPIRVLYVEGEPRWEFRFVKSLLERENKTVNLQVLLLAADVDWLAHDKTAIRQFPPKKELDQFDVVILGDFDPRILPKSKDNLRDLADFVKEHGGGLLMIAGEHFAPHAYKDTPLEDVLPITIVKEHQPPEPKEGLTESYRPELTPEGRKHPVFGFSRDEKEIREIWEGLTPLYWSSEGYEARRGAVVLATHPRRHHPLVVQRSVGKGISLFFGINETWRWRSDQARFNQFWIQTVHYLADPRVM
jgi:uncharacterized membrane protein